MTPEFYTTLKAEALEYYAYLVEDRIGLSADIEKTNRSLEIHLREDATISAEEAHLFCINLTVSVMESFNVFIPFKLFDASGNFITLETYIDGDNVDIITPNNMFTLHEEEDEEFHNFG